MKHLHKQYKVGVQFNYTSVQHPMHERYLLPWTELTLHSVLLTIPHIANKATISTVVASKTVVIDYWVKRGYRLR